MSQEVLFKAGAAVTWSASGGDAVLRLSGLADGAARRGGQVDLGERFAELYLMTVEIPMASAPTAGETIEVYLARSPDGETWPAGAYGHEGPYKTGEVSEWKKQFGVPDAVLPVTADDSDTMQTWSCVVRPMARYIAPVVANGAGVAVASLATGKITLTPLIKELQ